MCVCVSHTLYPGASEELAELRQTGIVMSFSWSSPDLGNLLNTHSAPKLASWRKCSPCWRGGPSLCNPRITADYLWAGTWPINSQVRPIKKWSGKKKKSQSKKAGTTKQSRREAESKRRHREWWPGSCQTSYISQWLSRKHAFTHSSTHSFNNYLLSIFSDLGAGDTVWTKYTKISPHGSCIWWMEQPIDNK